MAGTELTHAYRVASAIRRGSGSSELLLGTSGGLTETGPAAHPYLFRGFLTDPGPAALGMLACAAVAGARYYTPASVIAAISADPVVTSNGDRLRFVPAGRHAYLLSRILSAAELEILARVLDDRRPPWLASFVDRRLAGRNAGPDAWVMARRLVALGAIERPAIPKYTTRMLVALRRFDLNGTACRDGRLDPDLAARAIVTGVTGGAFKLNRVADGLQHASHDPVAAQRIVQTVFATADDLIPTKPSDLHLLLGLAARASAPATVPAAITRFAAGPNRSQLVTAARRLAGAAP